MMSQSNICIGLTFVKGLSERMIDLMVYFVLFATVPPFANYRLIIPTTEITSELDARLIGLRFFEIEHIYNVIFPPFILLVYGLFFYKL